MDNQTHKGGFLSGNAPDLSEKLTESQKNDRYRTGSMAESQHLFDSVEDDETPAIERKVSKNSGNESATIQKSALTDKPTLAASAEFEAEMHERQRKEREQKEKERQAREKREAEAKAIHDINIERQLNDTQSLDPNEIKEQIKAQNDRKNLDQLYPDPVKRYSDTEEAQFRKDLQNSATIPDRARAEAKYDSELHKKLVAAFTLNLLAAIAYGFALFGAVDRSRSIIKIVPFLYVITVIFIGLASIILIREAKKYKRKLPDDQKKDFAYCMIVPGFVMRSIFASLLSPILAFIPFVGDLLGTALGIVIGASIHYSLLDMVNCDIGKPIAILDIFAFCVVQFAPSLISYIFTPSISSSAAIMSLYGDIFGIILYAIIDFWVLRLRPNSHY